MSRIDELMDAKIDRDEWRQRAFFAEESAAERWRNLKEQERQIKRYQMRLRDAWSLARDGEMYFGSWTIPQTEAFFRDLLALLTTEPT